jgi:Pyruvate/2-oxoacid:ferredoxin oxidoreductase gamma subunit
MSDVREDINDLIKMEITTEQFEAYEKVRKSGVTNMLMISVVSDLSGLEEDTIRYIMGNYDEVKQEVEDEFIEKNIEALTEEFITDNKEFDRLCKEAYNESGK